ncbi:MAG: adenylosuccinate synthetase [Holophagales bacterium]|nr:adenylosuccinate synthetase [Holophagales bacterium]MBK9965732.1 adenylosuccinate synthetase [Holophagales bacterium]
MTEPSGLVACVGLGFGDEGKGKVVDALVRRTGARTVVRFGGGPQAAHHVVTPEGRVHCFAQFPSGMLVAGTRGWIAREMLIDPLALGREAEALALVGAPDGRARLRVDPLCRIVTPFHRLVGRMRELARGARRHGSCGRGVGEAVRDAAARGSEAIFAGDLLDPSILVGKLRRQRAVALDHAEQLAEEGGRGESRTAHGGENGENGGELARHLAEIRRLGSDCDSGGGDDDAGSAGSVLAALAASMSEGLAGVRFAGERELAAEVEEELGRGVPVLFEGAHGVLLDATRGFVPHVTATDTTFAPAERLAARIAPGRPLFRLGITRAYATRHGAGPFVTEDPDLTEALPEPHNVPNPWQGAMRAGPLDLVALRYALSVAAAEPVALAVTHLDRLSGLGNVRLATRYEVDGAPAGLVANARHLERCRPVYEERPGWEGELSSCRTPGDLPPQARDFLRFLASPDGLGTPVVLASVGPSAAETLFFGES